MDRISALSNRGMNQEIQDYINTYHDYDEDLIDDMQIQQYIPAMIYKEVKNAILAYLSLLRPPKESVYDIYQSIKSNFEKPKPPSPKEMTKEERLQRKQLQSILKLPKPTKEQKKMREDRLLNLPKRVKCLLDVYETYMSRSN
jgi:hypothetical protein